LGKLIDTLEARFRELGHLKALAMGVCLGVVSVGLAYLTSSIVPLVLSFLAYFPFHVWLTISLFLVVFSAYERARLVGPSHSFGRAFFQRLFSEYGVFCLAWFYPLVFAIPENGGFKS